MNDAATFIGLQAKAIMEQIADFDAFMGDEDELEVLIGTVQAWGVVEAQLLFPALESRLEGAEEVTEPARKRLNALYELQNSLHEGQDVDEPPHVLAQKYVDAVTYHLLVDVQDIAPLTLSLPESVSEALARSMAAMKADLE